MHAHEKMQLFKLGFYFTTKYLNLLEEDFVPFGLLTLGQTLGVTIRQ